MKSLRAFDHCYTDLVVISMTDSFSSPPSSVCLLQPFATRFPDCHVELDKVILPTCYHLRISGIFNPSKVKHYRFNRSKILYRAECLVTCSCKKNHPSSIFEAIKPLGTTTWTSKGGTLQPARLVFVERMKRSLRHTQICVSESIKIPSPFLSPDVCVYKGQPYQQDEDFDDGCQYKCSCVDALYGKFRCTERCARSTFSKRYIHGSLN